MLQTCESCLQKTVPWAKTQLSANDPAAISKAWYVHCTKTLGSDYTVCSAATDAVQNSYNGNIGKRAGNLCARTLGKVTKQSKLVHHLDAG